MTTQTDQLVLITFFPNAYRITTETAETCKLAVLVKQELPEWFVNLKKDIIKEFKLWLKQNTNKTVGTASDCLYCPLATFLIERLQQYFPDQEIGVEVDTDITIKIGQSRYYFLLSMLEVKLCDFIDQVDQSFEDASMTGQDALQVFEYI